MKSTTGPTSPLAPAAHRRRPIAFTLLELILVMAIVAVIVGLAIPKLSGFALGRRTAACADQLVALTRYAHTQSISTATVYRLNLQPAAGNAPGTYWLTMQGEDGQFIRTGDNLGMDFQVPDGVDVSWNAPQHPDGQYIEFQPTGRSEQAMIQVRSTDGRVITIASLSSTELFKVMTPDEAKAQGL